MLPLNSQKALFSGEEANVIRFALSIFLQTDFAGLTSKKEEEKAKDLAHLSLDKFTNRVNDFTFKEIGEILGKSENYCRVNFFREKKKLVKQFKD